MKAPVTTVKVYVLVWAALLALLMLTWAVAQWHGGPFNLIAALGIAMLKMLLVVLFFMHLRHSTSLIWLFAAAGFIWLLIMIDLTLSDYLTRTGSSSSGPQAFSAILSLAIPIGRARPKRSESDDLISHFVPHLIRKWH